MKSTLSPADEVVWPEDAIEVGRVADAWGIKGWIKVQPHSADPQALFSSRRWFLRPSDVAGGAKPRVSALPAMLKVTQIKEHGDGIVASVQEASDRNEAESLKGARIFVSRASFPTADPDEFYWVDLIGMQVVNRQGEVLGMVSDMMDTGVHSVLCVRDETASKPVERLIPFVSAYVDTVDQARRSIVVDWGLDY